MQGHQARQYLIPDIRADLPDAAFGTKRTYIEVKTVSGEGWYQSVRDKVRGFERIMAGIGEEMPGMGTSSTLVGIICNSPVS